MSGDLLDEVDAVLHPPDDRLRGTEHLAHGLAIDAKSVRGADDVVVRGACHIRHVGEEPLDIGRHAKHRARPIGHAVEPRLLRSPARNLAPESIEEPSSAFALVAIRAQAGKLQLEEPGERRCGSQIGAESIVQRMDEPLNFAERVLRGDGAPG